MAQRVRSQGEMQWGQITIVICTGYHKQVKEYRANSGIGRAVQGGLVAVNIYEVWVIWLRVGNRNAGDLLISRDARRGLTKTGACREDCLMLRAVGLLGEEHLSE